MSATTSTTILPSATTINKSNIKTSVQPTKEQAFQKMATEDEAKRVAGVAIQKNKLELAKKKAAEELSSKGKNAILMHKPSRPARRSVKKHRKPLSPPSNKEHDTRTATAETKASIEEREQLDALRVVRPSLNYGNIIEQRVINGVIERVTQPISSEHEFCPVYSDSEVVEQRVVNGVAERTSQLVDAPQTAPSTESDSDEDGDISGQVCELSNYERCTDSSEDGVHSVEAASATTLSHIYVDAPMIDADDEAFGSLNGPVDKARKPVKNAVSEMSSCSPLAILTMPNAALYPSRLSRNEEATMVAMHVAPVVLSVAVSGQQKPTKAEKKAAKAANVSGDVISVKSEVVKKLPEIDSAETTTSVAKPIITADDGYVATLLAMPNAPGMTKESGDLHEKLVAMHVTPLSLPVTVPKLQKTSKVERKAVKADQKISVAVLTNESDLVASLSSKPNGPGESKEARDLHSNLVDMSVAPLEYPLSFQQQRKAKKAKNSADTLVLGPFAEPVAHNTPATDKKPIVADNHTSTHDELNADDFTHIGDITDKQTLVIPNDATTDTPLASDHNHSSSESNYPNSFKTSRRSSTHSEASIRRKAEKARTTFLGKISLETFVNKLNFELCDGTTTKDDICETFATLAGHPTTGLDAAKTQRKIKLGSTSLYGFLRQLDFDDEQLTIVGKVMKVFNKAAKNEMATSKLDVALWLAESSQDEGGSALKSCFSH